MFESAAAGALTHQVQGYFVCNDIHLTTSDIQHILSTQPFNTHFLNTFLIHLLSNASGTDPSSQPTLSIYSLNLWHIFSKSPLSPPSTLTLSSPYQLQVVVAAPTEGESGTQTPAEGGQGPGTGAGHHSSNAGAGERPLTVEYPQFQAICRTLFPSAGTHEIAGTLHPPFFFLLLTLPPSLLLLDRTPTLVSIPSHIPIYISSLYTLPLLPHTISVICTNIHTHTHTHTHTNH